MSKPKLHEMPAETFCPMRQTIKLLGKRWTILIVKEIYFTSKHKLSFMQLRRRLKDISSKVLSQRLKEMAEDKMINRKIDDTVTPVRVYYTLTKKGMDTCRILDEFKEYGLKWGGKETFNCRKMDCELCAEKRDAATAV
ncbi:winged helix-turn-helix transcriptional regulator [Candidatus Altiarchaeota archaeon]